MFAAYAVEQFREASKECLVPQDPYFLVIWAGKAGPYHQKREVFGGL
jgi:hypothetical protein